MKTAGEYADKILAEDEELEKPEYRMLGKYMENVLDAVDFRTI